MKTKRDLDVDTIWNYMRGDDQAGSADCLLVLGSLDYRVAEFAAKLADAYDYSEVLISGGEVGTENPLLTNEQEGISEAELFLSIMRWSGYEGEAILETKARNTGENITLGYEMLKRSGTNMPLSVIIVAKPYMAVRARATFEKQWPVKNTQLSVVSSPVTFSEYCNDQYLTHDTIRIMLSDMQKVIDYPNLGFQTPQEIPDDVMVSSKRLIG